MTQFLLDLRSRLEEFLGGILALVTAVSVMIGAALLGFDPMPDQLVAKVWRYLLVGAICLLEVFHVCALYRGLGKRPYAVAVALLLPTVPLFFRVPISLFWLTHLFFTCGFVAVVHLAFTTSSLPIQVVLCLLVFGLSYLAIGYLLIAVATVKRDFDLICRIWRKRFWYAAAISAIAIILPFIGLVKKVDSPESTRTPKAIKTSEEKP